jgi:hypothetical protein
MSMPMHTTIRMVTRTEVPMRPRAAGLGDPAEIGVGDHRMVVPIKRLNKDGTARVSFWGYQDRLLLFTTVRQSDLKPRKQK